MSTIWWILLFVLLLSYLLYMALCLVICPPTGTISKTSLWGKSISFLWELRLSTWRLTSSNVRRQALAQVSTMKMTPLPSTRSWMALLSGVHDRSPHLFQPWSISSLSQEPCYLICHNISRISGESIPIRLFLAGYDLTPTMRDINKKFSVRYYLNLVLIDEEERRYFKQQVTEKTHMPVLLSVGHTTQQNHHLKQFKYPNR